MTYIKLIYDLEDGVPVQWVGVYALKWRMEWGMPSVGFVEEDNPLLDAAPEMLAALKAVEEAKYNILLPPKIYEQIQAAIAKAEPNHESD